MASNELSYKNLVVRDIDEVNDYLFLTLSNEEKVLTNGKEIYKFTKYNHLKNILEMNGKVYAVFVSEFTTYIVDLATQEEVFKDDSAVFIKKEDERTIYVYTYKSEKLIYDVETRKYLPSPEGYVYIESLGNNLYVFSENDLGKSLYEKKRCVINADGKILLSNIDGWIYLSKNHLILEKDYGLDIMSVNDKEVGIIQTIKKNDSMLAKPTYYDGYIILFEKGSIKLYRPDMVLAKEYKIDELVNVSDYEIVADTLKFYIPSEVDGEKKYKSLFIDLKTGKYIIHDYIEGRPYWVPTTYVGMDNLKDNIKKYHFYNEDFEQILETDALGYDVVDTVNECMFRIDREDKSYIFNSFTRMLKEKENINVHFHPSKHYGYIVHENDGKMDFVDEDMNIFISGFDFKSYGLSLNQDFSYFIVNGYLCLSKHIVYGSHGEDCFRAIIINPNGEIILDSCEHKCFEMGDIIQIISSEGSKFLNTKTGEIESIVMNLPVNEKGKIDMNRINIIGINNMLLQDKEEKVKRKDN